MKADHRPGETESPREPTELLVAPTRVGGSGWSGKPALLVSVVVVAFVSVAVWKPWDPRSDRPQSSHPAVAVDASPIGTPIVIGRVPVPSESAPPGVFGPIPTNEALIAATSHHANWGIRTMVLRPGGPAFTGRPNLDERWTSIQPGAAGPSPLPPELAISEASDEVVAIGVTTPDLALPLDVRFWHLIGEEPPERLAPIAMPGPEAGSWLWLADPTRATELGTWPAGDYEVEVLLGPRIERSVFTIPSSAPVDGRDDVPIFERPLDVILGGLDPGPFALADGGALPIAGGQPAAQDERTAWLGSASGAAGVATVSSTHVTGFGLLLDGPDRPDSIAIRQDAPRSATFAITADVVAVPAAHRTAIVARPTDAGGFPSGLYRVTFTWLHGDLTRTDERSVEIVPTVIASPPASPLDAMSRWAPLIDHPDSTTAEPLISVTNVASGTDACTSGTTISGSGPYVGIVTPPGVEVSGVRMLPLDAVRGFDVAIRVAENAIPRLTIVALPAGGLPVRDYDLILAMTSAEGPTRIAQRICVT